MVPKATAMVEVRMLMVVEGIGAGVTWDVANVRKWLTESVRDSGRATTFYYEGRFSKDTADPLSKDRLSS